MNAGAGASVRVNPAVGTGAGSTAAVVEAPSAGGPSADSLLDFLERVGAEADGPPSAETILDMPDVDMTT